MSICQGIFLYFLWVHAVVGLSERSEESHREKVTFSKCYLTESCYISYALMPGGWYGGEVTFSKCYLTGKCYFLCAHAARRPISANSSRNRRKNAAKESGNQRFPLFCISPSYCLVRLSAAVLPFAPWNERRKRRLHTLALLSQGDASYPMFLLIKKLL